MAQTPFNNDLVKDLSISSIIDKYNYNINHIDQTDYLHLFYNTNL